MVLEDSPCRVCRRKNPDVSLIADIIICICCEGDDERYIAVNAEFHRLALCRHVQFLRPKRHPEGQLRGSYESHKEAAREARKLGATIAWITEDDVRFFPEAVTEFERLGDAVTQMPNDWDIINLGILTWFPAFPVFSAFLHMWRAVGGLQHSYLVNLEGRWATRTLPNLRLGSRKNLDNYPWCKSLMFAYYPILCYQAPQANPSPRTWVTDHSRYILPALGFLVFRVMPFLIFLFLLRAMSFSFRRK